MTGSIVGLVVSLDRPRRRGRARHQAGTEKPVNRGTPPSADELEAGIIAALRAHDVEAVVAILRVLAVVDPRRASVVYDTLQLGLLIAS